MKLSLKRIVEEMGMGQYYDLGKDYSNFSRTIDGADDRIRQQYEQKIGSQLNGKRIRTKASRGYKQYVKDYEFDVKRVTIDDYYDNFVIVAQDNTTPKPKEYFLKPGAPVQIIGPATGQPSPQKGGPPLGNEQPKTKPITPETNPDKAQSQPMAPPMAQKPLKEDDKKTYEGYSIDAIQQDVKGWLVPLIKKPEHGIREFVKGIGYTTTNEGQGSTIALFDIQIPSEVLKQPLDAKMLEGMLANSNKQGKDGTTEFELKHMVPNETKDVWKIRIKKTTNSTTI